MSIGFMILVVAVIVFWMIVAYAVGMGLCAMRTRGAITFTWPLYVFKRLKDRNVS